ncbi:pyridoxal phosphate-dependent aminotransferase [Blastomonas aquatica]|uniref:Histidinol-phosphate aminotransferase n=1 Tax=Blastomonas aquatica TaxID=1510276 RepID=A0ABQ1JKT3_9SPHN|nr:histidinol-phosphate transaminase [Blastomonas aquatica]GGB70772.1 histidinol-phosphate aminotransferase [Blastomonas aquatica]
MTSLSQSEPLPQPKEWIEAIHAYVPGKSTGDDGKPLIKLSANENPLGSSALALAARTQGAATDPSLYPDPDSTMLRDAIGALHGLDPARIVCGTGSGELLTIAASAFAGPGDEVVYVRYGFSLYEIAARRCGATPVVAPDNFYATDVDALLACITDATRVVYLANPNNPTGTLTSRADLARLHAALPSQVLLVIDQAYAEYVAATDEDGALDLARDHGNVLVTRTFAKAYGLAGDRVGWGYGSAHVTGLLNRLRGPFNVGLTAQAAALAALADQEFVTRSAAHNALWRDWFTTEVGQLGNHGVTVVPSHANFVLVLFEGSLSAEAAFNALMKAGYIVRWPKGQGLGHALRITIGHEADMRAIAAVLRDLVAA